LHICFKGGGATCRLFLEPNPLKIDIAKFTARLEAAGAEILAPSNEWELLRFRSNEGVAVIYRNKRGDQIWSEIALRAQDRLNAGKRVSPAPKMPRRRRNNDKLTIIERDGGECLYCGVQVGEYGTVEHLVAVAHGGPSHISNKFLACAPCNKAVGHMSAPDKVKLAIQQRTARALASHRSNTLCGQE
jgi:5-methylcytosine-specific restriction endonuclease McrA